MRPVAGSRPRKVTHVTIGLGVGGAEMMLLKLLQRLDRSRFEPSVVVLMGEASLADRMVAEFEQLAVPIHCLGLKSVWHTPGMMVNLARISRRLKPDTVQGWMYHGNIAATLLARWCGCGPDLFWNIRHSLADPAKEKFLTRNLIGLGSRWSTRPTRVIHNSQVSIEQHAQVGYARGNACMIPNGFDTNAFVPDSAAGARLREQLGLPAGAVLVGTLGRRHPMKNQEDFLRAAAALGSAHENTHFVLAGGGVTPTDPILAELATAAGLAGRVHLIGPQDSPASYLAGLDVFCLTSSFGEGFPNVLGEAMSCGVPCVTTDVGEAANIVARWGEVVPVAEPAAITEALQRLLALAPAARRDRGHEGRLSIIRRYDVADIARQYEALYANFALAAEQGDVDEF